MTVERDILRAQSRIFRLAQRDYGMCLKAISLDSGIHYETLRTYAGNKGAQAMMPVSALLKLVDVIPDELLSHLLSPVGRHIVPDDDDGCLDRIGEEADRMAAKVRRARSPHSPGGTEITDDEASEIRGEFIRLSKRGAA